MENDKMIYEELKFDIGEETDLYFQERWQKLFADRDNNVWKKVRFRCEYGDAEYSFSERPVVIHGKEYPYKDILTPYAFSGPLIKVKEGVPGESSEELACRKKLLAKAFDDWFQKYCEKEGIVAEFVQFNPWIGNDRDFWDLYEMSYRSKLIGIDLTVDDLMMDEIHKRRRTQIRKAIKSGVTVTYDTTGEMIPTFLEIYKNTIEKYDVINYYQFSEEFLQKLFDLYKGQVCIACAMYEGQCINATFFVKAKDYTHYFLSGNAPEGEKLDGNSLVLYDYACKMKEEGCKMLVLGGAESKLGKFKKTFSRSEGMDYYSGQKIRLPEVYDMLVAENGITETSYFPKYRDPGRNFYSKWVVDES
ncbi:MAG: GNAT family N-acetyltransferase [Dorea sp.]|nr:GNAT family N-acetyltransferase [Dorea sp.]